MTTDQHNDEAGCSIDLPHGWEYVAPEASIVLLARPTAWTRQTLTPTITVVLVRSEAATAGPQTYLQAQLAGIATLDDPVVLSIEWTSATCLDLLLAHQNSGHDITTVQRHMLADDGTALTASASVADSDWPELAAPLGAAVASVRWAV